MARALHHAFFAQEARALRTRLARVRPLSLNETMVPAAALPSPTLAALDDHLARGRRDLAQRVDAFLAWLDTAQGLAAAPGEVQARLVSIRGRFNIVLSELDLFAAVLSQRSEAETGTFMAGLDAAADDALRLPGDWYVPPPIMCYVDRSHGAAIRRARTRLPGGGLNPVAIIRVPRERMVGVGIASSLVHEVGHQAAALLDLAPLLRVRLAAIAAGAGEAGAAWTLWRRWLGEILADLWAVARCGIAGPLGLIGVVSLPRAFVFRIGVDEPHPFPWIRVRLAIEMGRALWPDRQWDALDRLWADLYPPTGLDPLRATAIALLEQTKADLARELLEHRPRALRGARLRDVFDLPARSPARLRATFAAWRRAPTAALATPPSLAFAVLGQARADGALPPGAEGRITARLLTAWAVGRAFQRPAAAPLPVTT